VLQTLTLPRTFLSLGLLEIRLTDQERLSLLDGAFFSVVLKLILKPFMLISRSNSQPFELLFKALLISITKINVTDNINTPITTI
jgi:hypothetical protein